MIILKINYECEKNKNVCDIILSHFLFVVITNYYITIIRTDVMVIATKLSRSKRRASPTVFFDKLCSV